MGYNTEATIQGIGQLHFSGHIIHHTWFSHIKLQSGKPDLIAITRLATTHSADTKNTEKTVATCVSANIQPTTKTSTADIAAAEDTLKIQNPKCQEPLANAAVDSVIGTKLSESQEQIYPKRLEIRY